MTTSTTNAPTIFTAFTDLCDELGITPVDAGKKFTFSREVQIKLEPVRDFPVDQLHQVRDYATNSQFPVRKWETLIQEMHRLLQQSVMEQASDLGADISDQRIIRWAASRSACGCDQPMCAMYATAIAKLRSG